MRYKKVIHFIAKKIGFTQVEFLLILCVIGIIAAVSISVLSSSPEQMP